MCALREMTNTQTEFPKLQGLRLLVVDDNPDIVKSLGLFLHECGAEVLPAGSVQEAQLRLEEAPLHAVLADLNLMDGQGIELLPRYHAQHPEGMFYLFTGHASIDNAVSALKQGVRDYLQKPLDPLALAEQLARDLQFQQRPPPLAERLQSYLLFRDPVMIQALAELPRLAAQDQSVLIYGETGTGKELVAHALHGLSQRAEAPFVAINCGAIPEQLLEDELFGHEKGAFTGAQRQRLGRFEQAQGGTLFLDEIGEMPLTFQVRLLRVLEERSVQRVGGEKTIGLDVRVIAATHRDLRQAIEQGLFRQDLYYRLAVFPIALPPLRERCEDIPLLAEHFLHRALREMGREFQPVLDAPSCNLLKAYDWPGNVRELRNVMLRLASRLDAPMSEISADWLRPLLPEMQHSERSQEGVFIPAEATMDEAESLLIAAALARQNNNRSRAAQQLGIGERTLRRKLNQR